MNTQETTGRRMNRVICSASLCLTSVGLVVAVMFACPAVARAEAADCTVYSTGNSGLPYNGVTALAIDAQGIVWVGTGRWWAHAGGGLARFDGKNWTVYKTSNSGLPDNDHVNLCIDAQENVWSGTETGLSKFDGLKWTVYNTSNSGMMNNQSGTPVFDDQGNAWIACGCVARFDGVNWTAYHKGNSGLPNNFVTDVAIDTHGNIWASTFGSGVVRFDGQNWTVYNTGNSALPHNDACFLAADSEGNVWAGTYGGGLAKFNGTGWIPYTSTNSGLPDNWIWNLSVDPQNNVWAGTKAGLAGFDGARWIVYNKDNVRLPDNNVYCAAFDAKGGIWVGTQDGGLAFLQPRATVDFNGDGVVDIRDLLRLIKSWGQDDPSVDIGPMPFGDGKIDAADLEVLMSFWGQDVNDPTLAAGWRLDETEGMVAHDITGRHDGTLHGEPIWQPEGGKMGGALLFGGSNDHASTTASILNPAAGPFSVFAWVKGGMPGQVILSQDKGANWLLAGIPKGALTMELTSGRGRPLASAAIVTDGEWHRVGLVRDGSNRILYVDDVEVARDVVTSLPGSTGGMLIGAGSNLAAGSFWSGLIDDVRIYNRAVRP